MGFFGKRVFDELKRKEEKKKINRFEACERILKDINDLTENPKPTEEWRDELGIAIADLNDEIDYLKRKK